MHIFERLYDWCLRLAGHRLASWFLVINTFCESIFWPVPSDVMLMPMCLSRPDRAYRYALVTVVASVLGAVVGYYLGYFIYDPYIKDFIAFLHYEQAMETVRGWFTMEYGILMIFIGAFTPIPYKVIAVTCGLMAAESVASTGTAGLLGIVNFVLVSFVGRGMRFYLEAFLIKWGGARMEQSIRRHIDALGWLCVLLVVAYVVYKVVMK